MSFRSFKDPHVEFRNQLIFSIDILLQSNLETSQTLGITLQEESFQLTVINWVFDQGYFVLNKAVRVLSPKPECRCA
jgi:hypothetical protein